jgi:hypothetical protein
MNRVIVFTWTDAEGSSPESGWTDAEPGIYEGNCLSAGIVFAETPVSFLLAGSTDGTHALATHEVPKAMIHRVLMDEEF